MAWGRGYTECTCIHVYSKHHSLFGVYNINPDIVPVGEICGFLLTEFCTAVRYHCRMSRDHTVSPGERRGVRTCGLAQNRQEGPSGRGGRKGGGTGRRWKRGVEREEMK